MSTQTEDIIRLDMLLVLYCSHLPGYPLPRLSNFLAPMRSCIRLPAFVLKLRVLSYMT